MWVVKNKRLDGGRVSVYTEVIYCKRRGLFIVMFKHNMYSNTMGPLSQKLRESFYLRALLCFAKLRALLLKDRPPSKFREDTFNFHTLLCYLRIARACFWLQLGQWLVT